jgi:carbamoyl-phosphate synthase large subunit
MRVLVTAIGSMSGASVIGALKSTGCYVVGCDIYPASWHVVSNECDLVLQSPLAIDARNYIDFVITASMANNLEFIVPLTDVEVDVLDRYRDEFYAKNITLCIPPKNAIAIARNKYSHFELFRDDVKVTTIDTYLSSDVRLDSLSLPLVAKPIKGRSSEGIIRINTQNELNFVAHLENYIVQDFLTGRVVCVDYVRSEESGNDFCIAREEMLRTANGAGTTIRTLKNMHLDEMVSYIGEKLNINGCINLEFIQKDSDFYLIDINPRFSAGVAFSQMVGYDFVTSSLNCFRGLDVLEPIDYPEVIITKKYIEMFL